MSASQLESGCGSGRFYSLAWTLPSTFERLMERALKGLQWQTLLLYLDDVIAFSNNFESQVDWLMVVCQCFNCCFGWSYGWTLNCSFSTVEAMASKVPSVPERRELSRPYSQSARCGHQPCQDSDSKGKEWSILHAEKKTVSLLHWTLQTVMFRLCHNHQTAEHPEQHEWIQ